MLATCVSGRGRLVSHALVAGVLITACLSSACGGGTSEEAPKPAASVKNPVELVLRVKELAREVGGIGQLKQLVDLLAE